MPADDLDALARDMAEAGRKIGAAMGKAVKDAGEQARDDWRAQVRRNTGRRLQHFPASITTEVRVDPAGRFVEAAVGPDKDKKQGALGNIVEFGTSKHGPIAPAREQVADRAAPAFEKSIHEATEGLL